MDPASSVHASATVHPGARLGEGVVVGPAVVIEADVVVGDHAQLMTGTVLHDGSRIGADARIGPYAVVSGHPTDTAYRGEPSLTVIGRGAVLREFVTVQRATGEDQSTVVGEGALVMAGAHVAHNCQVGDGAVLTNLVLLGGHVEVGEKAFLGAGAMLHQWTRVGRLAMFGAASATNTDVLPFAMARGNPARHYRLNSVGLRRSGLSDEPYRALESAMRALRRGDKAAVQELAKASAEVAELWAFLQASRRGVARFVSRGD